MFDWSATVNNELLGTLGDFVGGILGTLTAIYSIAMLVKTLNEQIKLSVQQLFDNKFQVFFAQYKDIITAYVGGEA